MMLFRIFLLSAVAIVAATICTSQMVTGEIGPRPGTYEDRAAVVVANDKLEFSVTTFGAWLASVVLNDDSSKLNPLWNPMRFGRELGRPALGGGVYGGHFPCVDGFGNSSPEETAAGFPHHGEAHQTEMQAKSAKESHVASVTLSGVLPIVQERFTRTFRLVDGESVIYVDSQIDNLLGFDHPVVWAEHAIIGSPFLASGETVADLSSSRSHTRDVARTANPQAEMVQRLAPNKDFTWPMAPGLDGKTIDLRQTPDNPRFVDYTTTVIEPSQQLGWATAINLKRNLIIGWVFRRAEFPWLMNYDGYPSTGKLSRGFEFSTQPFDGPRRDAVNLGRMFDAPTFRWLPAKSKIESRFLMFYTETPSGFNKVDDIRLENHTLIVEDKASNKRIMLPASMGL